MVFSWQDPVAHESPSEDFAELSFLDLIDGELARSSFLDFLAKQEECPPVCPESAPRCIRVPLASRDRTRTVSVDVCHVPLPRLYGAESMHHLLSLTEDVDARVREAEQPNPGFLPSELLAARRPPSVASAASNETEAQVEFYDELAEMTLLLNANTELLDIEEAHLRFTRQSDSPKVRMGMPSLKVHI
ncbi:unnamed protein product [Symbiodinium natans]|uniref:Uncharacterized protein n=1 Tax=Symbiodinium natans TaxID=878477 RepID=A0A812T2G6_9DINO|nr:unnamed protein product [Symbiodinium natans]